MLKARYIMIVGLIVDVVGGLLYGFGGGGVATVFVVVGGLMIALGAVIVGRQRRVSGQ